MHSINGDICDLVLLVDIIGEHRPDVIFHLAAQSLVGRSFSEPVETYRTNVLGTVSLLEAVRRTAHTRVVVNVTSDKCYRDMEWEWPYRESDTLGGNDPYSSSKACSELITSAYVRSFFAGAQNPRIGVASARAGNVVGGGDWARDRLLPDIIRAALAGVPVRLRNPNAVRPWQHVLDALSGYLTLAETIWERPEVSGPWNFGPRDEGRSASWILGRVSALWGTDIPWELAPTEDGLKRETHYLSVDSSRALSRLGWRTRWGTEEALASTVRWYHAYREGADLRATSLREISQFQSSALPGGAHV
jgi:CDP-glucose 4,6-dehydratase